MIHTNHMRNNGLLIAMGLAALVVVGLWWSQNRSLTSEEHVLFSKLDAALVNKPPRAIDVIEAFNLPNDCRTQNCYFQDHNFGVLHVERGSLRHGPENLIFVLEGFGNNCIRSDRVRSYFDTGEPRPSCYDAVCWYTEAQHSWGILTFEVKEPSSHCVASAVINSRPEHRPKPQ